MRGGERWWGSINMDKNKYIKWYNLAREIIQNDKLIPDYEPWISPEDWLMFAPSSIHSREEAKNADIPNIFFDLSRNLTDGYARLGLTFNNLSAVEKLRNILGGFCKSEKESLTNCLLSLKTVWSIKVKRKIHYQNYQEVPTYIEEYSVSTSKITEKVINDIFLVSDRIRTEGQQNRANKKLEQNKSRIAYTEVPFINLMECEFELNEESFKKRIKEIFSIFGICLKVKDEKEIKVFKLQQQEVELEIQRIRNQLQWNDNYPWLVNVTEEQITQKRNRLKKLEEELKLIGAL